MKKINLNLLTLLFISVVLSSCAGLEKMKEEASTLQFTVDPDVLEMHAGKVEATINGNVPPKYFNKKALVTVTPVITWEGGEVALDPIILQGEDVQENNKVIPYDAGGTFSHAIAADYQEEMRVSELVVRMEGQLKDNTLDMGEMKVADGVIATPNLVQEDPKAIMMQDKFQRIVPMEEKADIHYVINKSYVRSSELRNEDIEKLKGFINDLEGKEDMEIKGAKVSAYASPDGPIDFNEKLSVDRQESGKRVLERELRGLIKEEAEFWALEATTEDWEGFKEAVQNSDIQDKDLILRVLSMYEDPVVREQEIRKMSEVFLILAEKILPELRRSKLLINAEKIGYSDEELSELAKTNPDTLNMEELLYAATLIDNNEEKLAIYQKTSEKYPECLRAQNNIGYVQLQMDSVAQAKVALEKANEMKENNPVVLNNLGAVAILEGDYDKAQELLTQATNAGEAVSYNLGIVAIKNGKYEAAMNYLSGISSFNTALAMILTNKNNSAVSTLEDQESQTPMDFYLKAVAGARMDNSTMAFDNLRTALGKDASLKELAKTDMEFAEYFDNQTFQTIVQ